MELYEFATNYPELYDMFNEDVRSFISENHLSRGLPLEDLENAVDNLLRNYEQQNYYGFDTDDLPAQQIPFDGPIGWNGRIRWDGGRNRYWDRDRNWDRNRYWRSGRYRRRFNDFDVRDIVRLLFFRELFDGGRGFW